MRHVVMFSGGISSWAAAKRVVERVGTSDVTLLFADTLIEDEDLYRFLLDASVNIGVEVTRVTDGRTPWQVFRDRKWLGNSRLAHCSEELKIKPVADWLSTHCDPASTTAYVGIDWTEEHRFDRLRAYKEKAGWHYEAPLCDRPLLDKAAQFAWLKREQVKPPRLYGLGFSHNNCGGFCVRAGHQHFATLWRELPDRYRFHEEQERLFRADLAYRQTILSRSGPTGKVPLSLQQLREELEANHTPDMFDIGGCGCFSDTDTEPR